MEPMDSIPSEAILSRTSKAKVAELPGEWQEVTGNGATDWIANLSGNPGIMGKIWGKSSLAQHFWWVKYFKKNTQIYGDGHGDVSSHRS